MPNEQLLDYVNRNLKRGYSYEQIKGVMTQSGYTPEEVEQLFKVLREEKQRKSGSGAIWIPLMTGIGITALLFMLSLPILFVSGFGKGGWFATYSLTTLLGASGGYMCFKVVSLITKDNHKRIIAGIVTPIVALAALILVFWGKKRIILLSIQTMARAGAPSPIQSTIGSIRSPFFVSTLYYIFANSFIMYYVIKERDYKALKWYLIAIPLYLLLWFAMRAIASGYLSRVL